MHCIFEHSENYIYCIWPKFQNCQQAEYLDSAVNVYMVTNKWDATFY